MRIYDQRHKKKRELAEIFEPYIVMGNALDYMGATLKEDAPESAKDAHQEYVELQKQMIEEKNKSPFL